MAAAACSIAFSFAISCGGGGGSVARVEMRQLRPAAFAREQERGLAFLPLDHARGAEQIELHGRFIRMQVGNAGARECARRCCRAGRAWRRHRLERRSLAGTLRADRASRQSGSRFPDPGSRRISIQDSETEPLLDARQPFDRRRHFGDLRVGARRDHEGDVHAITFAARGAVLDGEPMPAHQPLELSLEARMRLTGDAQVVPARRRRDRASLRARPAARAAPASAPSCPARDRSGRRGSRSRSAARPRPCRTS